MTAWTDEQKKVIELRGSDILVSAAAGSGKTAVLVERIIRRITEEENPVEIDRLLVVTFTKAAAAEMRERIRAAIERACENNPDSAHLRRQSALIHNAMITTIDSFCLFVVRNHFEEIGLEPNFRIADEGEIRLLEADTLAELFESNYAAENEGFLRLIDAYAGKGGDGAVLDMVAKIYRMSLSSPWPREWIAELAEPYQASGAQQLCGTKLIQDVVWSAGQMIADMLRELERLTAAAQEPDGPNAYEGALESDMEKLREAEGLNDYGAFCEFFAGLSFERLPAIRKFAGDEKKKEAVQGGRNKIKKELEELGEKYFSMSMEELLAQLASLRPAVEELVRLTLSYEEAMAAVKRKRRIVDFSDIEHFALQILVDGTTKTCKRTAEEFRAHFAEIMIDEYQDSNQVQEEIMRAISREEWGEHNLFMVGDVKQSIYRFRLACPELFMEKYETFGTEECGGERIDLHRNFRSRPEVVTFCNDIFYKLMSADLGSVAYSEDAALYVGASYADADGMDAELLLLDEADPLLKEKEAKAEGGRKLEAHMIASRIVRLMERTTVKDAATGEPRPIKYSDIVILLRSLKDWGNEFAEVLTELGVPAHVESATGYFSAIEVQTVLSFLRILDNPYQDIPMAAVLKSPMVGLDEEELAEIRISDTTVPFCAAAVAAMQEAKEGSLYEFNRIYESLRAQRDLPVHELIQRILDETGYGHIAAAMPAGEKRSANLHMLIEKALTYERSSYRGLFHFVRYIDQLQKYEIDFGEADAAGENADVVHIMTIHKSKGLEYPVVFVSGLGRRFNQSDTSDRLVVHPQLGVGISEIVKKGRVRQKRSGLYRQALAERIKRENLGEELRVLYVALTRAKEKLILTGTVRELDKTITKYTGNTKPACPISYRQRANAMCYLDLVLPAMLSYPEKYEISAVDPGSLIWDAVERAAAKRLGYEELLAKIQAADDAAVQAYEESFEYQYPYRSEAGKKSKYSVSELKHSSMVDKLDREEGEAEVPDFLREDRQSYVPAFLKKDGEKGKDIPPGGAQAPQGALRGTAVHRVMECMDFVKLASLDQTDAAAVSRFVSEELSRMREQGELTEELYELVIPSVIEGFVVCETAYRMAQAAVRGDLYREKPFVMQEHGVLIQGIIDVFWLEEDAIVLLDYKTDRVRAAQELILRYETQLKLYAGALTRIFSTEERTMQASECLIYSFRLQEVIRI